MSDLLETGDHCLPSHHVHLQPRSVIGCGPCVIVHVVQYAASQWKIEIESY